MKAAAMTGSHRRYLASEDLAFFVEHFWAISWDLRGQEPRTVETLPHPSVHLLFEEGRPGVLGGVNPRRFTRVLEGKGRVFGIKFRPGGFYPFWKSPIAGLADKTLLLREAFGAEGDALEQEILVLDSDEARMDAAERFLRARLPERDEMVALIGRMAGRIIGDRRMVKVDDLAESFGLSKRRLQRLFSQYVGISPKWMIQRYRLHEALDQLAKGEAPNWPRLALELGYFDQAHFIKDFKAMVGRTPAEYARGGA